MEIIDNRKEETQQPTNGKTIYYTLTEKEFLQMGANIKQLTELTNTLSNAMSAEAKMARGFLLQAVQNLNTIRPQKREE
jgi:hypothetical protein